MQSSDPEQVIQFSIARDAAWLLDVNRLRPGPEALSKSYLSCALNQGFASGRKFRQIDLHSAFTSNAAEQRRTRWHGAHRDRPGASRSYYCAESRPAVLPAGRSRGDQRRPSCRRRRSAWKNRRQHRHRRRDGSSGKTANDSPLRLGPARHYRPRDLVLGKGDQLQIKANAVSGDGTGSWRTARLFARLSRILIGTSNLRPRERQSPSPMREDRRRSPRSPESPR